MSTSRQFCRLASTLPSTTSLLHELISPESEISRPTISVRTPVSLRPQGATAPARRKGFLPPIARARGRDLAADDQRAHIGFAAPQGGDRRRRRGGRLGR